MGNFWKDIWKEEPPRNEEILFMTGDENVHIGCIYDYHNQKLRKCIFRSYTDKDDYYCDSSTVIEERVIFWFPLPIKRED